MFLYLINFMYAFELQSTHNFITYCIKSNEKRTKKFLHKTKQVELVKKLLKQDD